MNLPPENRGEAPTGRGAVVDRAAAPPLAIGEEFLASSFDGGTDLVAPLVRVANLLREEAWRRADVILVSDGEFAVLPETLQCLQEVRASRGARIWGVLTAAQDDQAMRSLCDDVVTFADWVQTVAP